MLFWATSLSDAQALVDRMESHRRDTLKGIEDLEKATDLWKQNRNSMESSQSESLHLRITMVRANIIRRRDGWESEELEDLLQDLMAEFEERKLARKGKKGKKGKK